MGVGTQISREGGEILGEWHHIFMTRFQPDMHNTGTVGPRPDIDGIQTQIALRFKPILLDLWPT